MDLRTLQTKACPQEHRGRSGRDRIRKRVGLGCETLNGVQECASNSRARKYNCLPIDSWDEARACRVSQKAREKSMEIAVQLAGQGLASTEVCVLQSLEAA